MVRSHRELANAVPEPSTSIAFETRIENDIPDAKINFDISKFSDSQIHNFLHSLRKELHERAMDSGDPEVMGLEYLERVGGGGVTKPEVLAGKFIALGGLIKYNSAATRHQCVLYSINLPGVEPCWAWEDNGTLAFSQSTRVGDTRQSVAVHVAVDGMQLIQHTMKHDGERHVRLSEDVWDCVWSDHGNGELSVVRSKSPAKNLPVPNH